MTSGTSQTNSGNTPETDVLAASVAAALPVVPGFELLTELERSTWSTLYRARLSSPGHDDAAKVDYALTLLNNPPDAAAETVRAMHRRTSLLRGIAQLSSRPGLPQVHEVGIAEGRPYLVTSLVSGKPLADLVTGNPLPDWHAITLVLDLTAPLAAMHRAGLVHGDLSPQTIVIADDGSARLTGVGLITDLSCAQPGALSYAAPEQTGVLDRPVDHRSDLYALGLMLFECLTGTLALNAESITVDPRSHGVDLSQTLAAIVATLLAVDPDQRYQSGEALATDLQRLLDDPQAQFKPDRRGSTGIGRHRGNRSTPVGRESELALLTQQWEQVRDGNGRGRCVVLRGVGGIGTSRLADEVLQLARRDGFPVFTLPCGVDSPVPLAPLRSAIDSLLHEAEAMPASRRDELHARIKTAAGTAAPLLAGLSPALAEVLDTAELSDGDRQDQFAAAVARFVSELARLSGGMVLVSHDAELVDPGTLRVIAHLATSLAQVPLLWVAAVRLNRQVVPREHPLLPAVYAAVDLDLVLEPLTDPAVRALVGAQLPGLDPDSPVIRLALERGHGNPFVIVGYLQAIIDAGLLRPHWGSWKVDQEALDQLELTDDPLGLVLAKLSRLEYRSRRLLVAAAVTGTRFRSDVVAEVCAVGPERVRAAMADAVRSQLIQPTGDGEYVFGHEWIREGMLDGVGDEELATLHQAIAEALDRRYLGGSQKSSAPPDRRVVYAIAQHYLLGWPDQSADRAFEVCRAAGEQALAEHAPERATAFLEHAAVLRPGDALLLNTLGTALQRDGEYHRAGQHLEEALVIQRDGLNRARTLVTLTEVYRATGDIAAARRTVERGLAELAAPLPRLRMMRAISTLWLGALALVITATGWGFATPRDKQRYLHRQQTLACLHLAGAHLAGLRLRPGSMVMHRVRAALAAAKLGGGTQYSLNYAGMGLVTAMFGLRRLTRQNFRQAQQTAAELGDPQLTAQVDWYAGAADYVSRVDDGERWIRCLREDGDWLDTRQYSAVIATLCWDAAVQGRPDDVLRWYEEGRKQASFGPPTQVTPLLAVKALQLTAAGRPELALAELSRLQEPVDHHGSRSQQIDLVMAQMYALAELDELGEQFDVAAARFFSFRLPKLGMIRQHRLFLLLHAWGRLAQCRAAGRSPHRARLRIAQQAVDELRAAADTPLLRAAELQCRAELYLLQDKPHRALELLRRIERPQAAAPLLSFEVHRTSARALELIGSTLAEQAHLRAAFTLVEEHGWDCRLQSLEREFGVLAFS